MKMSEARDELSNLLAAGHPDAELVLVVPTDSGQTFVVARRITLEPPENVKAKHVRLITGIEGNILFVKG